MERYYEVLRQLYVSALEFAKSVHGKDLDITVNMRDGLEIMASKPSWFSVNNNDYSAYFAFLAVYHALMRYYKYRAVYNSKDKELEEALNNWYKVVQPKQNILARVVSGLKRQK